jgi:hypothetical protein
MGMFDLLTVYVHGIVPGRVVMLPGILLAVIMYGVLN